MSTHQPDGRSGAPSGLPDEDLPDARRRRTILIAVCTTLTAVVASVSGPGVAQPDLAVTFGASQTTILWITDIHTLGLAVLLPARSPGVPLPPYTGPLHPPSRTRLASV